MSQAKTSDPKQALKHEAKGDKHFESGKFRDALAEYQKAEALNRDRLEVYEKLLAALDKSKDDWGEEDFSNSMDWTMRKQELEHPEIKLLHETFSVEYKEVQELIQRLMAAMDEGMERMLTEKILAFGGKANLPLVHFLLSLKEVFKQQP